jgi:hypothetical protein
MSQLYSQHILWGSPWDILAIPRLHLSRLLGPTAFGGVAQFVCPTSERNWNGLNIAADGIDKPYGLPNPIQATFRRGRMRLWMTLPQALCFRDGPSLRTSQTLAASCPGKTNDSIYFELKAHEGASNV